MYAYVNTHIYTHTYIYTHIYLRLHSCHIYIHACMHTYIHTYIHTCVYVFRPLALCSQCNVTTHGAVSQVFSQIASTLAESRLCQKQLMQLQQLWAAGHVPQSGQEIIIWTSCVETKYKVHVGDRKTARKQRSFKRYHCKPTYCPGNSKVLLNQIPNRKTSFERGMG